MNLQGIQKLTLLDFPEHIACTVFTGGCNFRCPYCHNASLVENPAQKAAVTEEEFFSFLSKREGILDGVAITGGEPTLQPDLYEFIAKIKSAGFAVKLDTNGTNPDLLGRLIADGAVDYVAMDIKNSPDRYAETVGRKTYDLSKIRESARILMTSGNPFEFRTTVVAGLHDGESMTGIGEWLRGAERFFLQQFVDSGDILESGMSGLDKHRMEELLGVLKAYIPNAEIRGV